MKEEYDFSKGKRGYERVRELELLIEKIEKGLKIMDEHGHCGWDGVNCRRISCELLSEIEQDRNGCK